MENLDFALYTQWSAYATLGFGAMMVAAFLFKWGIRYRLVGTTGFMVVLTIGLFGLSLGLFSRSVVPGAVRYSLVYDNGSNLAVVSVKPDVSIAEVDATLRQASNDLYSYGRTGKAEDGFVVRLRAINHLAQGIAEPLYLGQIRRSIDLREEGDFDIQIYEGNLAKLSTSQSTN